MDFDDWSDRPSKRRRFFTEKGPQPPPDTGYETRPDHVPNQADEQNGHAGEEDATLRPESPREPTRDSPSGGTPEAFDSDAFTSIVGETLPAEAVRKIRKLAEDDLERAVNVYFDGSWKPPLNGANQTTLRAQLAMPSPSLAETTASDPARERSPNTRTSACAPHPPIRYIGACGVGAWATRSGAGLVQPGEPVKIERTKTQPVSKRGRGGRLVTNHKVDIVTRFLNRSGQEVGRLPRETAEWVSTLMDEKICQFEGVCIWAPERLRVNDTVYLQLWCYLRVEAFQRRMVDDAADDNRSTAIFEEQESTEEKRLRLRQVALVKLFDEVGLVPTSVNEMTSKHKRDGLLRAAEISEQYDKSKEESDEGESAELEEDQLDTLYEKAQSFDFSMPEEEPPSTLTMDLRKYQKQALHWMMAKERDQAPARKRSMHPLWEEYAWPTKDVDEKSLPIIEGFEHFYVNPYSGELSIEFPAQEQQCLGGILADEMGLGKTIEMLSLIHAHRHGSLSSIPSGSSAVAPAPHTTLVVAPTSLLAQWESEALKASRPGTLRVLIYYGSDKSVNLPALCSPSNAAAPNVIITSYGTVLSEYCQLAQQPTRVSSGVFSVAFFRVILDEAHLIKNRRSKSARACYELNATHRWALTGTPIVNRLEDLFSLVRFLKVEPWNNFSFWKTFITVPFESKDYLRALNVVQTVLQPLVLRRTKTMRTPEGEPLVPLPRRSVTIQEVELPIPEREIYDHIYTRAKEAFNDNAQAGTLMKSYTTIFAQILRLRQTCCHPILTRNRAIVADEEDAAAAANGENGLQDDMDLQQLIDRFTTSTAAAASTEIQQDSSTKFTTHALKQIQTEASGECPICCEEPMINPAVTACWHSACKKCLEDYIRHQNDKGESPRCFSCRGPVSSKDIFEVIRHPSPTLTPTEDAASGNSAPRISLRRINPLSPSSHTSAKIHALIHHLQQLPVDTKSVVFSQFTSFLDLISPQLDRAGIPHARLDGTMPQKARAKVLAQFNVNEYENELDNIEDDQITKDSSIFTSHCRQRNSRSSSVPRVLLISLRAGGVGLNLTAANHVFMMDPWWSFAIEAQAIDRVHRMGQSRDVSVTRFIVKDSIEARMLRVQERKMNLAGSLGLRIGGDGDEDGKRKERVEELRLLFE